VEIEKFSLTLFAKVGRYNLCILTLSNFYQVQSVGFLYHVGCEYIICKSANQVFQLAIYERRKRKEEEEENMRLMPFFT